MIDGRFYARWLLVDGEKKKQRLSEHLLNVYENMREEHAGGLDESLLLLALLHDIGKYRPTFQTYMFDEKTKAKMNHAYFGANILMRLVGVDARKLTFDGNWLQASFMQHGDYTYIESEQQYVDALYSAYENDTPHNVKYVSEFMLYDYLTMLANVIVGHHSRLKNVEVWATEGKTSLKEALKNPYALGFDKEKGVKKQGELTEQEIKSIHDEGFHILTFFQHDFPKNACEGFDTASCPKHNGSCGLGGLTAMLIKGFKQYIDELYYKNEQLFFAQSLRENEWKTIFRKHVNMEQVLYTKYLFSLLVMADRKDAREWTEKHLPNSSKDEIPKSKKSLWQAMLQAMEQHLGTMQTHFHATNDKEQQIFKLRNAISDKVASKASGKKGVRQLTLPTGSGKNFTGFRFALKHAIANDLQRIVFVMPYISIIEQNAEALRNIVKGFFYEGVPLENFIAEFHSNINVEKSDEEKTMENNRYATAPTDWDSPVVVTTMVQYLESWYKNGGTRNKNIAYLGNSFLFFDEIQSLSLNKVVPLKNVLQFAMQRLGCSVVLSTATQPDLLNPQLYKHELPLMIQNDDIELIQLPQKTLHTFNRVTFDLLTTPYREIEHDEMITKLLEDCETAQNILVIVNYKRNARLLYEKLKVALHTKQLDHTILLKHLSTNMHRQHINDTIDVLKKHVGKNVQAQQKPVICISTNLIEVGMDLSFDKCYKEISRIDSIVQAAGRVNRFGTYEQGRVTLFKLLGNERSDEYGLGIKAGIKLVRQKFEHQSELTEVEMGEFHLIELIEARKNIFKDKAMMLLETYEKNQFLKPFATSGRQFSVIEKGNGYNILVKENVIEDLLALNRPLNRQELRQLNRYSVFVYAHRYENMLKEGMLEHIERGTETYAVLSAPHYYDTEFGLK
ncbi:MAG: CRISPR-associated helicase Cas3' [Caryophanon sp.]|nr:CRISPR-associated helicase Cas3' [Caryophanon sp.]